MVMVLYPTEDESLAAISRHLLAFRVCAHYVIIFNEVASSLILDDLLEELTVITFKERCVFKARFNSIFLYF